MLLILSRWLTLTWAGPSVLCSTRARRCSRSSNRPLSASPSSSSSSSSSSASCSSPSSSHARHARLRSRSTNSCRRTGPYEGTPWRWGLGRVMNTVEPLCKGHPSWWPFKRGGLSWGVKSAWFMTNGAWKWTKFCNFSETFLTFPEGFHCSS